MQFDFDKFTEIAANVYSGGVYSLEDALNVFRCFFARFEVFTGEAHPAIKKGQIAELMAAMPYIDGRRSGLCDIEPEAYPEIIDRYFETPFRDCNYRINHFFSGRVRELRMQELGY